MIDIGSLSRASGISQRRLRYVLDHNLLPGVELTKKDARGTRLLQDYDAFCVILAARMLAVGCPKGLVQNTIGSFYGDGSGLGTVSLKKLWAGAAKLLRLGDMHAVFVAGRWYTFDGELLPTTYSPKIELRFALSELRQIVRRAAE